MAYELLRKEVIGLSDDGMAQLIAFARFLKQEMSHINKTDSLTSVINIQKEPSKNRKIGFMADEFISIAPDFDTCIEGLEDYV